MKFSKLLKFSTKLSDGIKRYIFLTFLMNTKWAKIYGMCKMHKVPVKLRPVVSLCGSYLHGVS